MVRKTREEALKTKQNIMDVAKQLFCEKGYEKTNLSDIADVVGVTRGAIYWYFQNKDDLFIELCKDMIDADTNLFHH
ncbi:MAG: TetR family transcriptional regulator [Ruminobacter sp.]|uniref:TetR family transcriptional regulator n=1 Tax=Ruminobacter sp. TaxID=2774296 RepID=UPI001B637848|nr:TetR family transcriptional regulator [Ruminobacter sp.]MBP3749081.1 TetR family transcriptional regulator [Ruminobacter sp.]